MRKVTVYPVVVKSRVLAKALAPNPTSVVELAREFNIPYATIHSWVKNMIKRTAAPQCPQDKSAQDKLQVVIDTADKTVEEQAAYCRKHGIYTNHLNEWKKQILEALGAVNTKKYKSSQQKVTNEVKQLKPTLNTSCR